MQCFNERCERMSKQERERFRDQIFMLVPEVLRNVLPRLFSGLNNNIPPDTLIVGNFGQRAGAFGY
ncbi:MAG: hypothetical protein C0513_08715, partial [Isosphaera sp.]|nr:hypothetical protein [Isosphaera sp.]